MLVTIQRQTANYYGIFSKMQVGETRFYTLEHAFANPASSGYLAKVKPGTYTCLRGIHKLHDNKPFETFEVTGVKGHTGILFHVGNYNEDSDGCILVGDSMAFTAHMITDSRKAFAEFMKLMEGIDQFTLTVIG